MEKNKQGSKFLNFRQSSAKLCAMLVQVTLKQI